MGLIEAKCTNCGGVLSVDQNKDAMVCPYCGAAFVVEKAIHNFSNYYTITNNITAENVYLQDEETQTGFKIVNGVLEKYTGVDEEVVIPEGVVKVGYFCFGVDSYARTIKLPDSLCYVADHAFCCKNCTSIGPTNNILEVGDWAFSGCAIRELDLSNATKVGNYVVDECDQLEVLKLRSQAIDQYGSFSTSTYNEKLKAIYIDGKLLTPESEIASWPFFSGTEVYRIRKDNIRKAWIKEGKCKYCGGDLKGLFTRVCKKCGKEQS